MPLSLNDTANPLWKTEDGLSAGPGSFEGMAVPDSEAKRRRHMNRNPRRAYDGEGNEIPPMTLGGMREQGIRTVNAFCEAPGCHHKATLDADRLPDHLPVPDISLKLRCSKCGNRSIHTRPNWSEMQAAGMGHDV